jgi:hypothetical protein
MIVPSFWAESRVRYRKGGRQITVRRFGWSDASPEAAQAMADARAREALERAVAGDPIGRFESRVPYNGAEGLPIREEIVGRYGETVVTRNSYGAKCLNTPNVLFADVDYSEELSLWYQFLVVAAIVLAANAALLALGAGRISLIRFGRLNIFLLFVATFLARAVHGLFAKLRGGPERAAIRRVRQFVYDNPHWNVRIYRTPAGLRVMATHEVFHPNDFQVTEFFDALKVDPIYARMCRNQQCFRARVSPKPWRIGIQKHLKPNPGVWPVDPYYLPARNVWLANYDQRSTDYAACRFVESVGSGVVNSRAKLVQELHDQLSQANTALPIA